MKNSGVVVTGANGFLGRRLISALLKSEFAVSGTVRSETPVNLNINHVAQIHHGIHLEESIDWRPVLQHQEVVIHTAGRVHVMDESSQDPLSEYRKVNVEGSLKLAESCVAAGVKRLIFISTIKVNGEQTSKGKAFHADDPPAPEDPYSISKNEAETGLLEIARRSSLEVVIIRPPLVYGPGVKGNFLNLIRLVEKRIPLPLGSIHNKRSLVAIDNLIHLVIRCIQHPAAVNQIFLAGDGVDLSTTELISQIGKAMGRKALLAPVPESLLKLAAAVLGKKEFANRLLSSLQVDISKTCELLQWKPPVSVGEGLNRCFIKE